MPSSVLHTADCDLYTSPRQSAISSPRDGKLLVLVNSASGRRIALLRRGLRRRPLSHPGRSSQSGSRCQASIARRTLPAWTSGPIPPPIRGSRHAVTWRSSESSSSPRANPDRAGAPPRSLCPPWRSPSTFRVAREWAPSKDRPRIGASAVPSLAARACSRRQKAPSLYARGLYGSGR